MVLRSPSSSLRVIFEGSNGVLQPPEEGCGNPFAALSDLIDAGAVVRSPS